MSVGWWCVFGFCAGVLTFLFVTAHSPFRLEISVRKPDRKGHVALDEVETTMDGAHKGHIPRPEPLEFDENRELWFFDSLSISGCRFAVQP